MLHLLGLTRHLNVNSVSIQEPERRKSETTRASRWKKKSQQLQLSDDQRSSYGFSADDYSD